MLRRTTLFVLLACCACSGSSEELACPPGTTPLHGECVAGTIDGSDAGMNNRSDGGIDENWSVRVDPTELDFGVVPLGETKDRTLTISNDGQVASEVTVVAILGDQTEAFSLDARIGRPIAIAPGASVELAVRFGPVREGAHAASIELNLCSGGCRATVALRGEGRLAADRMDFYCQASTSIVIDGGSCETRTLRCFNAGAQSAQVLRIEPPLAWRDEQTYAIEPLAFPVTVPAGQPFEFDLEMCTQGTGSGAGDLAIQVFVDDGTSSRVIDIALHFEIIDVSMGCSLDLPSRVNFGRVAVGHTVRREIVLQSRGSVCPITPSLFSGADPGFTIITAPFTLQPDEIGTVEVAFTPIAEGHAEARLRVHPSFHLLLSGYGGDPNMPTDYEFSSHSEEFVADSRGDELPWIGGKDDGYAIVPMPFDFEAYGAPVTELYVSANGFISFEPLPDVTLINSDFPDAPAPNASVAWWWDDLVIDGATLQRVEGTAPNRILRLLFYDASHVIDGARVNAEVWLFEGSNAIEFHYGTWWNMNPYDGGYSSSVGWEGPGGLVGQDTLGCTPACRDLDWPSNVVYRFVPGP